MNLTKYAMINWKNSSSANRLTMVLLAIYLIALTWILLFKLGVRFSYMANRRVNLIPFGDPSISNGKTDFGEIIMNVMIFIPLGVYAGMLFKKRSNAQQLLFFFLTSLLVELLQFVLGVGSFDITDTITNSAGGIIGLILFKIMELLFKNSAKAQKFVNIVATAGTVLVLLFLVLLKTNHLWIRYQ